MIIELRPLDDSNIEACRKLKVPEKQAVYIGVKDSLPYRVKKCLTFTPPRITQEIL